MTDPEYPTMPLIPEFLKRNKGEDISKKTEKKTKAQLAKEELEAKKQAEADRAEAVLKVARDTMKGDLRDMMLDLFKNRRDAWQEMGEYEQREVVGTLEAAIGHAIDKAVRIIAADGRETITAQLDSVTVKDEIKAVLKASKSDPQRHTLFDCQGMDVLIVVASGDAYHGASNDAEIDADEPPLPLNEDEELEDAA